MASDMKILKALGKEIGVELKPAPMSNLIHYRGVGYVLDEENRVVALAPGAVLETLPTILCELRSLQALYLNLNRLTSLPPEITQLREVQVLDLSFNRLTSLPPEITQLRNLQELDLRSNGLTSLPPEIAQLQSLKTLHLSSNQLTSLPPEIIGLKSLQALYLSANQLTDLPPAITRLQSLRTLSLRRNQLTSLPPEITQLPLEYNLDNNAKRGAISLRGNPLESPPPEIVSKGREAVIAYFRSLEGEKRPLNEVRILLVGDGAVGKTSLVKGLLGEPFDPNESQTHGINIRQWQVEAGGRDILGHFWDFGGQEIMHATHQFFLSRRSVYVLVLDGRKDEKTETWLKTIESFGGDSPVMVVLNKTDENPGFDVNRRFLQQKYPGIQGFWPVSCAANRGIKELRGALEESLTKVKILETLWADSWFRVKQELEQMSDHFVNYESYVDLCDDKGVRDKSGQTTLVEFLNDLGVVVHFQDFELQDVYVLEPKWVTEGVYKIINSEELARNKGILELRRLPAILTPADEYPREKQRYIIDLMKKFELCYEIDKSTVLVPDLLEVQEPAFDFDDGDVLRFRVDYDFLPRSVMPLFIVRLHQDIHQQLRWRTGVVLRGETFQSTAVVRCDYDARRIDIRVSGLRRRDYFAAVVHSLREINGSFEKLGCVERVPLPDNPGAAVSYENLLRHEQAGVREIMPDNATRFYDVKSLLGTVQSERDRQEQILELQKEILAEMEETKKVLQPDVVVAEPSFMGFGINLKALFDWFKK